MKKQQSKTKSMKITSFLKELRDQPIKTWFDLGLLIDQIRETSPKASFPGDIDAFKDHIQAGGIGLLSFYFSIDGITVEANKYTQVLQNIYSKVKIHYIAGDIQPEADDLIQSSFKKTKAKTKFAGNEKDVAYVTLTFELT